jgi:hypothetical protein
MGVVGWGKSEGRGNMGLQICTRTLFFITLLIYWHYSWRPVIFGIFFMFQFLFSDSSLKFPWLTLNLHCAMGRKQLCCSRCPGREVFELDQLFRSFIVMLSYQSIHLKQDSLSLSMP